MRTEISSKDYPRTLNNITVNNIYNSIGSISIVCSRLKYRLNISFYVDRVPFIRLR